MLENSLHNFFSLLSISCKVPECDVKGVNNRDLSYKQPWLPYAIPTINKEYEKCYRYAPINSAIGGNGQCSSDMFNKSQKIACTDYIYASDERNLQTEVKPITDYCASKLI